MFAADMYRRTSGLRRDLLRGRSVEQKTRPFKGRRETLLDSQSITDAEKAAERERSLSRESKRQQEMAAPHLLMGSVDQPDQSKGRLEALLEGTSENRA